MPFSVTTSPMDYEDMAGERAKQALRDAVAEAARLTQVAVDEQSARNYAELLATQASEHAVEIAKPWVEIDSPITY